MLIITKKFCKKPGRKFNYCSYVFERKFKYFHGNKSNNKHSDLIIEHYCRFVKQNSEYWVIVPILFVIQEKKKPVNAMVSIQV